MLMRRTMLLMGAVAVAVVLASAASGSAGSGQARWTITDLGPGGAVAVNERGQIVGTRNGSRAPLAKTEAWVWERGRFTLVRVGGTAVDVNERGQVVGWDVAFSGETRGFIWQKGSIRHLGSLGGFATYPNDINDAGQVVGTGTLPQDTATSTGAGFLWQNGKIRELAGQGDAGGSAYAVNGRGQVVGAANTTSDECGSPHAAFWSNGKMNDLNPPGAVFSEAVAVNARGQVAVQSLSGDGCNGFISERGWLWDNGTFTDLGTLGGRSTIVLDLNDHGDVIGSSKTAGGRTHAFVWRHGVMRDLGTLPARRAVSYEASAINETGQVIGSINGHSAFTWQDGTMTPLGSLGGMQSVAAALNEHSQIVGWATTRNGKKHAVLWTLRSG